MKMLRGWRLPVVTACAAGLVPLMSAPAAAFAQAPAAAASAAADPLPIDMLYALPSIAGTSPEAYVWSPDGKEVAFVWNDKGLRFRDLWVYSTVTGEKRRLTDEAAKLPADNWRQGIAQVEWLPGGRLAYVLGGRLYTVGADGASTPIADAHRHVHDLRRSPDGRYLAFVDGGPTDPSGHMYNPGGGLWVIDLAARGPVVARQVAAGGDRINVDRYRWAADGRSIAFVEMDSSAVRLYDFHYQLDDEERMERMTRPFPGDPTPKYRLGVVTVADGATRWMDRANPFDPIWNFGLSSNGRALFANTSDFLLKHHAVLVYDVASGKGQSFYSHHDPDRSDQNWQVEWAPGDKGLVILTDVDGYSQLYLQGRAGEKPRRLTTGKWDIASFTVDAAHGRLYFIANESHVADRQFYRVPAGGGKVERLSSGAGTHQPVYAPDFSRAADRFSNDNAPPELYLADLRRAAEPTRVTRSPLPAFDQQQWATVRYITFPSHVDGAPLVARLTLPRNYDPAKRYPLIVGSVYRDAVRNQWGGRTAHPTWGLDQTLAARGYMLLNVNIRGSWGQGRAHSQGLDAYGSLDVEDLESGVRHLVAQGMADPKRVGIWGSSYGGLMTLMSLYRKPGLYAVGIAGAPATNVWHAEPEQMRVMGEPTGADFPGRYEQQSPLYHTKGLKAPLMIIHGTKDRIVLYADTQAMMQRLIKDGKTFELVALPGSDHSWDTQSQDYTLFSFNKMVEFFDRYLTPGQ